MTNHEKSNSDHTQSHHEADTTPEHERQEDPHPRIWIASLADYNNGRLHGAWVDAAQDPEGLEQAAWRILAGSPEPGAEEWAIHDYDGFGPLRLGEFESFADISAVAKGIAEHGPAFAAWAEIVWDGGGPLDHELLAEFPDYYMGDHESPEAWAEEMCDDLGYTLESGAQLPEAMQPYVCLNYQAFAEDMRLSGEVSFTESPEGGVWVFRAL